MLVWTGLPEGFRNLISCIYYLNASMTSSTLGLSFFCWIMSGVLQGCPLSGLLFVLILDPFLRAIEGQLESPGLALTRACADDIGAVVYEISTLKIFHALFTILAKIAGLHVKDRKCVIIPIATRFAPHVVELFRDWLCANLPEWGSMAVVASGKYLGFALGPGAGASSWSGPIAKWRWRVSSISAEGFAPSVGTLCYNFRSLPVLGYVAQLLPPPADLLRLELDAEHRILHFPGRVLAAAAFVHLDEVGMVPFHSAVASCSAAIIRTALSGKIDWRTPWRRMTSALTERLPFCRVLNEQFWGAHWVEPACFCSTLAGCRIGAGPDTISQILC